MPGYGALAMYRVIIQLQQHCSYRPYRYWDVFKFHHRVGVEQFEQVLDRAFGHRNPECDCIARDSGRLSNSVAYTATFTLDWSSRKAKKGELCA